MRKTILRLLALILTLAMALTLTACGQDDPAQDNQVTQPKNEKPTETELTQAEPMVRLYFPTESISYNSYGKFEYEERWWEKDEFIRIGQGLDENGNETVSQQVLNTRGEIRNEDGDFDASTVACYENGRCVYSRADYAENEFGTVSSVMTYQYDTLGRLVEESSEMKYEDPEKGGLVIETYVYTDTQTGSVGMYIFETDVAWIELHYDQDNRLTEKYQYMWGELFQHTKYEYNSAGCQTRAEVTNNKGELFWGNTVYDFIEVPLSVAQKWPMFKWEYIE